MKYTISTEIIIEASSEAIWRVLIDQEAYSEWNPFITRMVGNLKKGRRIEIIAGGMKFKPEILEMKPGKELRWLGKLFIKGLFDGEHIFIIEELNERKCRFIQVENFSGILVGLFMKKLERETKPDFVAMNKALKFRAESLNLVTS